MSTVALTSPGAGAGEGARRAAPAAGLPRPPEVVRPPAREEDERGDGQADGQPPKTAERTVTRTGAPNERAPSAEVTVIVIGNVPEVPGLDVERIVLLPGLSATDWSAPFGKSSFALSRWTRTLHVTRGFEIVLEAQRHDGAGAT